LSAALPLPDIQETVAPPRPIALRANDLELYGLTSILIFAPLAFGAVEAWAIFVLQFSACLMFCTWIFRQVRAERITIKWNPVFSPMAGFGALALIQLVPGVSAYRHATYSTLLLYTAYGFVCFLLTQFLERTSHLSKLGSVFSVYGVTVAVFAVLQSLSASGKLYWIRTPRFGGWIYGPYVNHNHYAGLMEMLCPRTKEVAGGFSSGVHGRNCFSFGLAGRHDRIRN